MRFRLTPRSMTLDDFELLQGRILSEFRGISQSLEPTMAKRMKIDPYCPRRNCCPLNVLFSSEMDPSRLSRQRKTKEHMEEDS